MSQHTASDFECVVRRLQELFRGEREHTVIPDTSCEFVMDQFSSPEGARAYMAWLIKLEAACKARQRKKEDEEGKKKKKVEFVEKAEIIGDVMKDWLGEDKVIVHREVGKQKNNVKMEEEEQQKPNEKIGVEERMDEKELKGRRRDKKVEERDWETVDGEEYDDMSEPLGEEWDLVEKIVEEDDISDGTYARLERRDGKIVIKRAC